MGSFMEYHNKKNNTTATTKTSSSSSFMEYHNKRQKEREEEEERRKAKQQSQENVDNFQSKINNKELSTLEELQKEYNTLSTTEKAQIAKQINSKSGAEKIALSSNKFNNTPLINLDETKLKTEKDLKIDNLKNDTKAIGSNLLNSAKVGGLQFLKSMAMNVDKTQNMYIDAGNQMNEMIIKEMEKEGKDTSHLKQLYREKYDSKPFYQEKIDKLNQKMAENTEKATNPTSKKIAEISQGLGNNIVGAVTTAINPAAGLIYFTGSAKGNYYDEAIQRGMSEEEAENYSGVMALMEGVTERYLAGENIKGFKNILKGQGFKNAVKSFGIEVGENFVQEAVMPSISEVTALATAGKEHLNYDFTTAEGWENLLEDSWSDGIDGALSSIMLNGATKGVASATRVVNKMKNGQTVTQQEIATAVEDSQKAGVDVKGILQEEIKKVAEEKISQEEILTNQNAQVSQDNVSTNIENTHQNENVNYSDKYAQQVQNNTQNSNNVAPSIENNSELDKILNNKELPMQGYKYETSNNAKINNLRQQAGQYFNNSQEAHKFMEVLEKIITDKDIEIRLEANLKTTDGRIANGSYSNGVITINPNSARTGEFIAIHELTHAIGTKSMMNIVENYRKSNVEFNSAVESLLQNYNTTELTEEALSDVSAQLFGNQEFINNIANTNPGFFKKIYNEIKYLWHQFRGYKSQNQFVEDLYYKWTQAYNSNNKLNETSNYLKRITNSGIKYTELDGKLFKNTDGTLKTPREAYNSIVGQTLQLEDGSNVKLVKKLPGNKDIYNELIKRQPRSKNVNDIKNINNQINGNIDEILEQSDFINNKADVNNRHKDNDIISFDTREAKIYDGNQAYNLTLSIAELSNGEKVGYAKKFLRPDNQLTQEIKKEVSTSSTSKNGRSSRMTTSNNSITSKNNDVNTTTKYSMQESENNTELSEEAKKQLHRYVYMDTKQLNKTFSEVVDNKENMLMEYNALQKEYKEFQNTEEFKHALNDFVSSETPKQETTEIMNKANKYAEKLRYYNNAYEEYKAKQDAINSLLMGNATDTRSTQQIVKEAEKHFGITNNFKETAYIDINGNQIDFSGKHEGGPSGARTLDHRQINEIDIDMDSFIDIGNIRILPEGGGINLKIEPNAKQYNKLREYIDSVDGEIYIDIDKTKSTYDSAEYKKGTPTSKIINDLQYYFKNGKFPAKSEFADFRYSQNNKSWQQHLDKNFKATGTRTNMKDIGINVAPTAKNNVAPSVENNVAETAKNKSSFTKKQNGIKENEKIAEVLEKPIGKVSEKNRTGAILKANLIDKGMVFEELSRKTNNRELQGKWDYILTAEARGQNAIGQARYEMDANTKTEKQISKSLEDIRIEVGDKTSDFQNYMYHQLNIDRMTLEERFSGDTGINYERKGSIKNKPVFSKSVTADISKKIVAEYEQKNPEFKNWAKDVYDFLDANKKELIDRGVISQELSDKLSEFYPHYVPIKRVDAKGLAIKVPLDTNRTGINSPLAKATGGNSDIQPLFQTIADRTLQTYKASARNNFGVELMNTLNSVQETSNADIDTILEEIGDENTELLHEGKNGNPPTFTVFENGEKKTFEITKDMYDALKPQSEWIKQLNNNKVAKFFNKVSNFRRGVLTEYNALFSLTNPVKDFQGIVINSEHPAKTFAKFGEAYAQITKKGYWYNEYIRNGGKQNSYFKDGEFTSDKKNSRLKTAVKIPFETISKVNNVIEMAPRLAEYIASREEGRSIEVSMLDAARVTTNFKAGGDFTKTLNRNGFTFLNASVQGFQQQVRNIQDAHAKGLKGYSVLATKYAIAGLPTIIFNYIVWKDDEDYEELQDYVKDNYYCIAKYGDGKFIRIPKERVTATIQKIVSNAIEYVTDDKELNIDNVAKDFWENLNFAIDNLAPNNPLDNNVLSPIIQTITNTSWYGEDIVPSRLQDKPKAEQYDETTDSLSIWLGEKLNQSPYKINYLLDQYGGGISDIVLPRFTKQAENNVFADKFTTDATMKSKYPGEFYTKLDELKVNANSDKATDEDIIKYKYASTISSEISELYNEKREIQNSSLSDNTKKEKLKLVQEKINKITKESLNNISSLKITGNTVTIGDIQFYKDGTAQWNKVSKEEQQKNKNISLKTYADYKNKTENMKKDNEKINVIANGNYTNKEKIALYENYILSGTDKKYSIIKETGIDINEYLKYKSQVFSADKEDDGTIDGKTVNGSKAIKVWNYIENMNISYTQKLLLYGLEYTPSDSQQQQILNYVKSLPNKTNKEKLEILSQFNGFTIYKDGTVEY